MKLFTLSEFPRFNLEIGKDVALKTSDNIVKKIRAVQSYRGMP